MTAKLRLVTPSLQFVDEHQRPSLSLPEAK
jgi:hypothetical protein